ncbi:transforming growth factor beta-1-induced transcript 1 protein-like protein, partial [Blyttiomyces helicus]
LGGRRFHPEHLLCNGCSHGVHGETYFEKDLALWCEVCFHERFSPKCEFCNLPIKDRCINALHKTFHPEHFFCCQCGKVFDIGQGFMESDGKAYCEEDFMSLFANPCFGCAKPLLADYVTAVGQKWHRECFGCAECGRILTSDGFFEHDGRAYCERDYHTLSASKCAECGKPVIGRAVRACGKRYHIDHFFCSFCKKVLEVPLGNEASSPGKNRDPGFMTHNGKPYCKPCHTKFYG